MLWENLREEEFKDAIKKSGGLCILPVGCLEKHGQHLPVGTDAEKLSVSHRGSATGITGISNKNNSEKMFDLQGRQLDRMPDSGIIIRNNKKIYIK